MSLTIDRYRTKYHIDTSLFINQNIKEEEFKSTTSRKRVSTITNSSNKKPLVIPNVLHEIERCTKSQLFEFLQLCKHKYGRARLEPCTAVGVLCAQSIGEPAVY